MYARIIKIILIVSNLWIRFKPVFETGYDLFQAFWSERKKALEDGVLTKQEAVYLVKTVVVKSPDFARSLILACYPVDNFPKIFTFLLKATKLYDLFSHYFIDGGLLIDSLFGELETVISDGDFSQDDAIHMIQFAADSSEDFAFSIVKSFV